jgi:outer membrane protein assembly factor BamE
MRKPLIFLLTIASFQFAGCSTGDQRDNAPTESFLETIPIVYRQDIQQGNIVTQEMVDKLQPGMSKSQVRFLMGTPMLADTFHNNRWDYVYTMTEGWGDTEKKRLTLVFEQDRLVRLEGDYRPQPTDAVQETEKENVVSVPDYVDPDRGIIRKAVDAATSLWGTEGSGDEPPETKDTGFSEAQKADAAAMESAAGSGPP